jgi:3-hydroxyacyl-CoA dehydrogenase/enoyl-CoA hydratase/3-hydroxybutyryl-CoA epimerase
VVFKNHEATPFGAKHADVVIEAISENLKAKQELYQLIEPVLKEGAILATNTSSLPLDQLNKVLKNPERLVSIHYFNPVEKMKLVEVARGEVTSDEIFNKALAFVRGLDRLPLPVHSSPGFLVNRILMPYLLEAMILLEEGVPAAVIDKAAVDFGMPMGPIELADTVGLDICLSVADILSSYFGDQVPERLREKVAHHEYGRKTGKGFYIYQNGKPLKETITQTDNLDEIADRLIFRMLNESVKCLQEGIVADADLVDAGMIFGTGFAPFRGGPLYYAKSLGIGQVVVRMRQLQDKYGSRFKPADGWKLLQSKVEPVVTE